MAHALEKFSGFAAIEGAIRAIWKKYGVKKSEDLPPEGQDEVRAAVAAWQKAHTNKLGSFMEKTVKPLGLSAFEKAAGLMFGPAAHTAAHALVDRAQSGDFHAKAAIGTVIKQAAGGNPTAQRALQALTTARQQIKAFGPARAECLLAQGSAQLAASSGAAALPDGYPPVWNCIERGKHAHLSRSAEAGIQIVAGCGCGPSSSSGEWIPTAGGQVFVPHAYSGTAAARAARASAMRPDARSQRQVRWAFAAERRGELPLGTAQRWAERAVSGYESLQHGTAQTLRESLGLNIALK